MADYSHLKPGQAVIGEETDAYQILVERFESGWNEMLVWKPGYEPVPEPTETDRLRARVAELENLLVTKGLVDKTEIAAVAEAELAIATVLPIGELKGP